MPRAARCPTARPNATPDRPGGGVLRIGRSPLCDWCAAPGLPLETALWLAFEPPYTLRRNHGAMAAAVIMATVLITGANRGVGLALARRYAARGDHVIALVREPATAENLRAGERDRRS